MAKIRQSNIDPSVITGNTTLNETANNSDLILVYDQSSGSLKQISKKNLFGFATISSVSPTSVVSGDGTGNYTFTITGAGFAGGTASLINNSGSGVAFDTVTVDSDTQITGVIAKSSLPDSGEPYDVKVTGTNGLASVLENQINVDASPIFNTAAGSLGTINDGSRSLTTIDIEAQDPESAGNVTFEIQSGSLPAGTTATTVHENGVSKFRLSGFSAVGSNTTSNFVIRAVDAASNTSSRAFSIVIQAPQRETFTSSGTFTVPTGYLALTNILIVAGGGGSGPDGGGGGAGGLIFMPVVPVTPGTPISVTVGDGGTGSTNGQDSVFGTLIAKGGGYKNSGDGGSGGGVGRDGGGGGGDGIQPCQPGNSGAYGFGNPGGVNPTGPGGWKSGGGGGGAGAAGTDAMGSGGAGNDGQPGRPGGIGKAYTIADGTTPVYYAGGGGGSARGQPGGSGGQGGGGDGTGPGGTGQNGTANRGGGAGAPQDGPNTTGGKGIVIVEY